MFREFLKALKTPEQRLAWLVAMVADGLQITVLPFFVEGGFSPADVALDAFVAITLIRLLGWHWAFLPTMMAELAPGFPTVTRKMRTTRITTTLLMTGVHMLAPNRPRTLSMAPSSESIP